MKKTKFENQLHLCRRTGVHLSSIFILLASNVLLAGKCPQVLGSMTQTTPSGYVIPEFPMDRGTLWRVNNLNSSGLNPAIIFNPKGNTVTFGTDTGRYVVDKTGITLLLDSGYKQVRFKRTSDGALEDKHGRLYRLEDPSKPRPPWVPITLGPRDNLDP